MDNNGLPLKVGIFLFDGAETTDFIGPYDVFSAVDFGSSKKQTTLYQTPHTLYDIFTVSETKKDLHVMAGGLVVKAEYDFNDCPEIDILVVPGGLITEELLANPNVIGWLQDRSRNAAIILSVCSGAVLLAKAGLLSELSVTTHHLAFDDLLTIDPTIMLKKDERFVDNGRIITAAGVTAGYDAAMHIVYKTAGRDAFFKAGEILEYGDAWKSIQRRLSGLSVHRTINDKCIKCGKCAKICPFGAVVEDETQFRIQLEHCVGIGPCAKLCPVAAIESSF
ncbi:DJ-1/PfpI family protein [Sporomusa sp. KB1]|jgi:transcriptional regulator GlxA family with amidase domain|uniref:DJ-1/PfpI family protein n=1 Tax=Sporomusa sp. KB1 TaxID=943346 RepID=UPI0011A4E276|nr:DJ-1/PfpI family protein [Sporomusa sp. KB1]TWH47906.1 Transcriptional regulator containing an amidase domain and an AraC-type DNA-binding HTH domain [Sporomusa sp. KB1]